MKKMLPDLLGTAGLCLVVGGLYLLYGLGLSLVVGGVLLMVGGVLAGRSLKVGRQ